MKDFLLFVLKCHILIQGVDESCSITLLYPGQRIAQINVAANCKHLGTTFIAGEKGCLQVLTFFLNFP